MVVVDIEDGHPPGAAVEGGLGGDGGVVQIAVAAHDLGRGVVARRAAEGEGAARARGDLGPGTQGHLGGAVGGLPGPGGDGRAAVEAVVTEASVQAGGRQHLAQGARRPGIGQQVHGLAAGRPFVPGAGEKVEIGRAMDACQRRPAEVPRRHHLAELPAVTLGEDEFDALGFFETGLQLAIDQFAATVVQGVIGTVVDAHGDSGRRALP